MRETSQDIWLLGEDVLPDRAECIHDFQLRDSAACALLDHGGIWLLELSKFHVDAIQTEQERWLKFFKDGERLDADALPTWMHTEEMQQAMSTLKTFSEKDRAYHAYQARQNYLREQRSIQLHIDELRAESAELRAETEQHRAEKDAALQREAAALAEIERLKAQLSDRNQPD